MSYRRPDIFSLTISRPGLPLRSRWNKIIRNCGISDCNARDHRYCLDIVDFHHFLHPALRAEFFGRYLTRTQIEILTLDASYHSWVTSRYCSKPKNVPVVDVSGQKPRVVVNIFPWQTSRYFNQWSNQLADAAQPMVYFPQVDREKRYRPRCRHT